MHGAAAGSKATLQFARAGAIIVTATAGGGMLRSRPFPVGEHQLIVFSQQFSETFGKREVNQLAQNAEFLTGPEFVTTYRIGVGLDLVSVLAALWGRTSK